MGRVLKEYSSLMKVEVLRNPGFLSFKDLNPNSYKEAKDTSPYKAGDIVMYLGAGKDEVKTGLIVCVTVRYSEHTGDWIPVYRTRMQKKDGSFSKMWVDVWPGYISRAEEKIKKQMPIVKEVIAEIIAEEKQELTKN